MTGSSVFFWGGGEKSMRGLSVVTACLVDKLFTVAAFENALLSRNGCNSKELDCFSLFPLLAEGGIPLQASKLWMSLSLSDWHW